MAVKFWRAAAKKAVLSWLYKLSRPLAAGNKDERRRSLTGRLILFRSMGVVLPGWAEPAFISSFTVRVWSRIVKDGWLFMVLPADIAKGPVPEEPDRRLRRHQRLRSNADFQETYAQGKSWAARTMVLWLRKAPDASLRLGVVSSRIVGKAVQRNRARRRLREAWRLNRHRFHGNVDVVLVARRNILTAKWEDVTIDLMWLAKRAGILT